MLQTISELNAEGLEKQMHFNLVGKGPLYEQMISEYKLPNITFAGFADDEQLKAFYTSSDAFIFPTLFEGMPTVVLEAMSFQLKNLIHLPLNNEKIWRNNRFIKWNKNLPGKQ